MHKFLFFSFLFYLLFSISWNKSILAIYCGIFFKNSFLMTNPACKQGDAAVTHAAQRPLASRCSEWGLTRSSGLAAPLVIGRGQVGAVAAFGHGVSSQLVPGGVQGEVLELRRHLFPFLGPLVEAERLQQAADLVRLHFLHGNRLTCQEGETHTHVGTHTHSDTWLKAFEAGMHALKRMQTCRTSPDWLWFVLRMHFVPFMFCETLISVTL